MAYLGLSPEPVSNLTQPWEDSIPRQMPIFYPEVQMTPQQIEAQVKREQSPMTLYVIGAIAAYLLLMR